MTNHSWYTTTNNLYIVGEVINLTEDNVQFVRIDADVFNTNQLIDTDFTFSQRDVIPTSQRSCFRMLLDTPTAWTRYDLSPGYQTGGTHIGNLTISNDSGSISQQGWYEIIGQVQNDNPSQVNFVKIIGTLYDQNNVVIDCDFTYVNSTDLAPGQTSSFKIVFSGRSDYTDVSSYRLEVQGQ